MQHFSLLSGAPKCPRMCFRVIKLACLFLLLLQDWHCGREEPDGRGSSPRPISVSVVFTPSSYSSFLVPSLHKSAAVSGQVEREPRPLWTCPSCREILFRPQTASDLRQKCPRCPDRALVYCTIRFLRKNTINKWISQPLLCTYTHISSCIKKKKGRKGIWRKEWAKNCVCVFLKALYLRESGFW